MIFDELNEDNFTFFAIQNYNNPHASTKDDFTEDLKRIKYVQRHLKKYGECGEIKIHLLINHIVVLYNVFGEATTPMLFYKSKREYWSAIKTILIYISRYPSVQSDSLKKIQIDYSLYKKLQEL
jgi:hypothetical protein